MSNDPYRRQPNDALAEMMQRDLDRDDVPFGGPVGGYMERTPIIDPRPPIKLPPPDWEAEED